jgi:hypothetical protein
MRKEYIEFKTREQLRKFVKKEIESAVELCPNEIEFKANHEILIDVIFRQGYKPIDKKNKVDAYFGFVSMYFEKEEGDDFVLFYKIREGLYHITIEELF